MLRFVAIVLLFLLGLRLFLFYQQRDLYQQGEKVKLDAILLTEPIIQGRLQRIVIRASNGQRVFISTSAYPQYHYGEELTITGIIQQSEKGVSFLSFPEVTRKPNQKLSGTIFSFLGLIRSRIITFFGATLPPISAGLLLGIVFGIREQIPKEFVSNLRSSGVLHVVAASGMNVSIIVSMLTALSVKFLKRQYAMLFVIPAVFFYCLLAGFDPPIVRACIMGLLAITASLFGRQYFGLLALALSAYVMLFIWPYLPFDIGFQLSFFATLGIIIVKPLLPAKDVILESRRSGTIGSQGDSIASLQNDIKSVLQNDKGVLKRLLMLPIDDIRTTLAAQIATLPILLFSFGQYGMLSVLVNAATLWMVPILMALGLIAAIVSFILFPLAKGIVLLALPLLLLFESAVSFIGGFHTDIAFKPPLAMVMGYYLLLGASVLFIYKSKKHL